MKSKQKSLDRLKELLEMERMTTEQKEKYLRKKARLSTITKEVYGNKI